MPRYIIERSFTEGLEIPINDRGAEMCRRVAFNNAEDNVTWLHSYVSEDGRKTFCAYEAPSPEAIRRAAAPQQPARRPDHGSANSRPIFLSLLN